MVVTAVTSRVLGGWCLVSALLFGCGAASSRVEPPGVGGNESGGEAAGGAAGAGTGNLGPQAVVTEPALAPGNCGIVRRIQLESLGLEAPRAGVARQAGGLSLGPWNEGADSAAIAGWFLEDGSARWRSLSARGSNNDVHWPLLLAAGSTLVEVYVGATGANGEDDFNARSWASGDNAPQEQSSLLKAWWRGTDSVVTRPSLAGDGAVFAIWPLGISEPRAVVIGSRGTSVGVARSLAAPEEQSSKCAAITPTLHGGVVSFVGEENALHLVEMGLPEGEPIEQSLQLPSTSCPLLALDDAGLSLLVSLDDVTPEYGLYQARGAGSSLQGRFTVYGSPLAFASTSRGLLVLEQGHGERLLELFTGTDTLRFALGFEDVSQAKVVPSEAGRILLEAPDRIVELGCN